MQLTLWEFACEPSDDGRQAEKSVPSKRHRLNLKKESEPIGGRATVVYARVSTRPQKADLDRQVERLSTLYPGAEVVKEVGGGLNLRRKGLINLLGRVLRGDIRIIVVAHKDRLARFGFDIIEWLCEQFDCKIISLKDREWKDSEEINTKSNTRSN
ncbi:IS607 family transposase [Nostoc commune]|uniref:IS607 family transposase n=1 Tax=Nostoc commune TaxID=1178 RepID=UPI0018C80B38|nr:IS607 family transposase [Nostoc commune]MBG1260372.1 IS607 family transposase [Nostoc commune BAE]